MDYLGNNDTFELKQRLRHVLFIGGTPDCGKTSLADAFGEKYRLQVYHFDRHEPRHFERADPLEFPALYRAHPARMTPEERWLGSSPEQMAEETIDCWSERFSMALEDILGLPRSPGVIAEGPGFFPERLAPVMADRRQAIWLVPSPAFKIASAVRRDKPGSRWETSEPERAQRNLIERDLLMGKYVRETARELGLTVYEVDGSRSLEQVQADVEDYFGPLLTALPGRT